MNSLKDQFFSTTVARGKIFGKSDPNKYSDPTNFMNAPDILYHGSKLPFVFSPEGVYVTTNDNSCTAGKGFYCTSEREVATSFTNLLGKSPHGEVKTILPFNANMLVCHSAEFGEEPGEYLPLPKEIVNFYIDKCLRYEIPGNTNWNTNNKVQDHKRFLRELKRFMNKTPEYSPHLRVLIQTCSIPTVFLEDGNFGGYGPKNSDIGSQRTYGAPPISGIWEETLAKFGYDGVCIMEGVDNMPGKSAMSYVFMNLGVIGGYDSWKIRQNVKANVALLS